MHFKKIIAFFSLLFVLGSNQAFAGKKNKNTQTAATAADAPKEAKEAKEAKGATPAAARAITQEANTLSQKDDVTRYNGASNLCGWYAVWHTYQMLNNQALSNRSSFEHFYFNKSNPTFGEEKENLPLSKITQLIQDHKMPNTCAIAIGSHGEVYEGKTSFASLDLHNPIGIVALTTMGHWIGININIDLTQNPNAGLVTMRFADSHDDNVMESKDAFASATRNAVQAIYDQFITKAEQLKTSEAKTAATPTALSLVQATSPASSNALSSASTASSNSSPASTATNNTATLSLTKMPTPSARETQQAKSLFTQAKKYETDKDFGTAFKLYRQAATAGHALAQVEMGNYLYYSDYGKNCGITRNVKEAVGWYESAVEKYKDPSMLYNIAKIYTYGDTASGITPNHQKALQYTLLAADEKYLPSSGYDCRHYLNYMEANERLGQWYLHGNNGCIKDEKTAHKHFTIAYQYCKKIEAHKHTPKGIKALTLHMIGYFHETGYGTRQNCTEAIAYYKRAANTGSSRACLALGDLFMKGKIDATSKKELFKPDAQAAYEWYCAAKQKPDVAAAALKGLYTLGNKVGDGIGFAVDLDLAIKCFAQGNAVKFLTDLGWCYQARAQKTTNEQDRAEDYKASFKAYKRATEVKPDDMIAWHSLGIRYEKGQGTTQDMQQAWACYQKAITFKNASAHIALGNLAKRGFNASGKQAEPDPIAAMVQYKKALTYPRFNAKLALTNISRLGRDLDTGTNTIKENRKLAAQCYTICAEHPTPDANACLYLAYYYHKGIVYPQNYEKAVQLHKKAVELNPKLGPAWFSLGYCYHVGTGTTQDINQAIRCYQKAIDNGFSGAAYSNLGCIYEQRNEPELAIRCYNLAAQNKNPLAQNNLKQAETKIITNLETAAEKNDCSTLIKLSALHANPQSTQFNQQKAVYYLTKAAVLGDATAQYELAQWYERGLHGLTVDPQVAFRWYYTAGSLGHEAAQHMVGRCYEEGNGVNRDLKLAALWYNDIKAPTAQTQAAKNRIADAEKHEKLSSEEQAAFNIQLQQTEKLAQQAHQKATDLQAAALELEKILQETQCWPLNITMTPPDDSNYELIIAEAQWRRGMWYPENSQELQHFYAYAAENKHPMARWYQATNASFANCYHNTFNDLQFACQHNYTPAWYNMGRCYQQGQGVSLGLKQAQMCYQKVLDAKIPDIATINRDIQKNCQLAKIAYEGGLQTKDPRNASDAITSFSKAAAMGYIPAFYKLSQCYADDTATFNKALYYCLIAAQYGNANAQYTLGQWFMTGKVGQRRNTTSAFAWYELAVANGSREALFPLAECYANGYGTKQDMKQAIVYYTQAAYQFNQQAIKALQQYYNNIDNQAEATHWQELAEDSDVEDDTDNTDAKEAKTATSNRNNNDEESEEDVETVQQSTTADTKQASTINVTYEDKQAVEKQINQFGEKIQRQLQATLRQFTQDPLNQENALDIKKLKDADNVFRIRSGKQRIIFKLISGNYVITSIERRSDTTYSNI